MLLPVFFLINLEKHLGSVFADGLQSSLEDNFENALDIALAPAIIMHARACPKRYVAFFVSRVITEPDVSAFVSEIILVQ